VPRSNEDFLCTDYQINFMDVPYIINQLAQCTGTIEKYSKLISKENLLVPSAYDSDDETEDEQKDDPPGASPYPIGFKWVHDPNGIWRLTSVSTSKTRRKEKGVGEAVACALTQDIPEGSAARFTIADGDDEADADVNYPLRERAPDPRREQDNQEQLFSEVRTGGQHREPLRKFFAKAGNLPHNFCPETVAENYQMPNLAEQATGYSDGLQDPPRPANRFPKRWRQVKRARKNSKF
jgi:hypothetical protein